MNGDDDPISRAQQLVLEMDGQMYAYLGDLQREAGAWTVARIRAESGVRGRAPPPRPSPTPSDADTAGLDDVAGSSSTSADAERTVEWRELQRKAVQYAEAMRERQAEWPACAAALQRAFYPRVTDWMEACGLDADVAERLWQALATSDTDTYFLDEARWASTLALLREENARADAACEALWTRRVAPQQQAVQDALQRYR
ncbi:hypothetical protein CDCA_CDCA18G4615 [Cyanidium caldarium]|uniref:Uncharacterized protein n=1 Tax=Cyanidium caldarium TaxID=2771 RepID=A0AAV9J2N9_CYACA|nr:hypothetical protein CDCA_CDCA18G4615 [Cyanidium caldarium]